MDGYDRCIRFWDGVYETEEPIVPQSADTGIPALTAALDWLCDGATHVLDFGCGNGAALCWCALRGVEALTGIDLSPMAIRLADARGKRMTTGRFDFRAGGVDALHGVPDAAFDGIILMNILDNLYPRDAETLLHACARLLRPGGKALITLNPHLSPEQISAWNIRVIDGNLLDDGLLLHNLTSSAWQAVISRHLAVLSLEALVYPGQDQPGRLIRACQMGQATSITPPTGGNP